MVPPDIVTPKGAPVNVAELLKPTVEIASKAAFANGKPLISILPEAPVVVTLLK